MTNGIILRRWYIRHMLKHGHTLITNILTKHLRRVTCHTGNRLVQSLWNDGCPIHMLARFCYPLNLPPGISFQRHNVFLSLIIPGHPGVFMDPVIDELIHTWEKGVWTYDRATKTSFKMHVWYHYSLHDFLAYGLFAAWCVHGKFPCPICKEAVRFIWLKKGGKYSSFDQHR